MLIDNFNYAGFGVGNVEQAEEEFNLYNWKGFFCFALF